VLGSVVSFGYYGRVIRAAYMDAAPAAGESGPERPDTPRGMAAVATVVFAVAIVLLGVFPLLM
jgi:NADH:ubiquinone oxidoreductase subunit 2 (subunit N)